jgi:hypothetical protein
MKVKTQQKKQRGRSRSKILIDALVVLFCLSGAISGLYLFWNDLNRSLVKQSEVPVGIVSFKRNTAQRRFQDRLIWSHLQRDSPIYNGDIIRTAELSDASITFLDGNTIDLAETSFIQIFYDQNGARIELSGGAVNVNATTRGITLISGGTELKLSEGSKISAGASGLGDALNLQVIEGNASINTGEGIEQVESGNALTVRNDGSTARNAQVVVSVPLPNQRMITSSNETVPIDFAWSTANFSEDEHTRIEVAADRNFAQLVATRDTNAAAATIDLPAGTYFWRAFAAYPNSTDAPVNASSGRLSILRIEAPVVRSPLEEAVYSYRVNLPTIRFQWSGVEHTDDMDIQYLIEIADNTQMLNPQLRTMVSSVSYSYGGLDEGIWYWRVTPIFPADYQGTSIPSQPVPFVISRAAELSEPSLLAPESGSVVNNAVDGRGIYFSWKKENDAASYTLQLARDIEFRNPVFSRTLAETVYTWNPAETAAEPGRYYWRVSYSDTEGTLSPLSEARFFTAISGTPAHDIVFPPDNYIISDEAASSLRFVWRTNLPFGSRFQIASSSDFSNVLVDESINAITNERAFQGVFLDNGTYYWRVSTSNATGDTAMQTPVHRLTIASPLPEPQVLEPQGRVVPESNDTLSFSWRAVPDAELYEFSLYEGSSLGLSVPRLVYQNQNVRQTSISLPRSTVREGAYFWTVGAVIEESSRSSRRTSKAALGQFQLSVPQQILLEYPPANYAFTGIEALRQPNMLRWSSPETLQNSRLIVSRNQNLSGERTLDIASPSKTVSLPILTEGTYYWTVQGTTAEGVDISAQPQTFRVLGLDMPRISLDFPQTGYTYTGIDAFRRPGSLQWSSEERIGTSRFILSRNADLSGTPVLELNNPGRSIALPQLTEGTYYWTVQAATPEGIDISAANPRSFRVLPMSVTPVALEAPIAGHSYTGLEAMRRPGAVRWNSSELLGTSRFILSRNADLSGEPVYELVNPNRTFTLPQLSEGTYYWTIQATTPEGIDISAQIQSFRVLQPQIARVRLETPAEIQRFTITELVRRLAVLRWSSTEPVRNSRFILSRSPDPVNGVAFINMPNPETTLIVPRLDPGVYYWTIQAETPEGIDISAETTGSFEVVGANRVRLEAPTDAFAYNGLDALRQPGMLRWGSSEPVGASRLIISRSPDITQGEIILYLINPPRTVTLPKLTPGAYYWTVQAETPEGIDISAEQTFSFRVLTIPLLEPPRMISPLNNAVIDLAAIQQGRSITFTWGASPGANAYIFTLAPADSPRNVLIRSEPISQTVYTIGNLSLLDSGNFIWQVEPVNLGADGSIEQRGEIGEAAFSIDVPPLSKPNLGVSGSLYGE